MYAAKPVVLATAARPDCCDYSAELVARSVFAGDLSAFPDARLYGAPTLVRWNRSLPFAELLDGLAHSLWKDKIAQFMFKCVNY
jgi:hypothetical protein